ncbi:primosomal protein DnaI [Domibacillus robiginosus]|uniref:primosomal protein DnaI n=1 Tax=Domibacillus robiginosus TaxID=1071054 RepID=UPI00067BAC3B|nr:primosomal protein DnaI [Domibacillus robiginosus]
MKRINESLKKMTNSLDFQSRFEAMRNEILSDPSIRNFIEKNKSDLSDEAIQKNLVKLYEYKTQSKKCDKCPSLSQCINIMQGFEPELLWRRGRVELDYHRCSRKINDDQKKENEKLIKSLYVPKNILNARFDDLDFKDPDRHNAIKAAEEFVENYIKDKQTKGLYIYGAFGVGKSYLLGAIANDLAEENNTSSLIMYFPEFVREMKQSLSDQSLDSKLEKVKSAPVLMIDDIGAESMSSWVRDDILGTILQFRMLENLPTLFTSNFKLDDLEYHLTYSQRGEQEGLKAKRIMERIKYLALPVEMAGMNRRH